MRRFTVSLLVSASLLNAASAHAGMSLKTLAFDPAGKDDGTNRSLTHEWIYLINDGSNGVQMRGWRIVDRGRDHVYRFGSLFLNPGDTVKLHSGRGSDGAPVCEQGEPCPKHAHYDFYWKLDNYVWNNGGDRARLIRPNGNIVDACTYTASADSPFDCD